MGSNAVLVRARAGAHVPRAQAQYRFAVCSLAMVPPAICIGAIYPLAMSCVGAGGAER